MSIFPLEQFETDVKLAQEEREIYEKLKAPKSMVVRFGYLRLVGEYPYTGNITPGCGSKIVVRTHRGTEIGEMLTSTCPNAGCAKSVTRQEMLEYIENSGGKDYPFYTDGKALRVATIEDMNRQAQLESTKSELIKAARARVAEFDMPMKIIEAEPILGEERLTFYFTSEERIDFRDLVRTLAEDHKCRIELRQVGARDEARITADYERCGQHCCCKQFLKVLKPVSMRSAKTQKATLDPLKISGRCGRLMCCLRYEDETYETLKKRLPRRKKRVGTLEGPGIVVDSQILTQLVLVELDSDRRRIAVPVEELRDPDAPLPVKEPEPDPFRGVSKDKVEERTDDQKRTKRRRSRRGRGKTKHQQQDDFRAKSQQTDAPETSRPPKKDRAPSADAPSGEPAGGEGGAPKKKRRRRGRRGKGKRPGGEGGGADNANPGPSSD